MKTVVSVIGKDAVGIISEVSAVCAECNVNIVDITQSVLQDMFVMVMLTEIDGLNCTFAEFSDKMKALGIGKGLDIRVMHEDIFNSNSPKVVLSADGHALYFSRSAIPFLRGVEPSQWQSSHTYYKHIGLYAYRSDVLRKITALPQGILERCESLEQLRWLENGYRIRTAVTMTESLAIDTPQDLQAAVDYMLGRTK